MSELRTPIPNLRRSDPARRPGGRRRRKVDWAVVVALIVCAVIVVVAAIAAWFARDARVRRSPVERDLVDVVQADPPGGEPGDLVVVS